MQDFSQQLLFGSESRIRSPCRCGGGTQTSSLRKPSCPLLAVFHTTLAFVFKAENPILELMECSAYTLSVTWRKPGLHLHLHSLLVCAARQAQVLKGSCRKEKVPAFSLGSADSEVFHK